MMSGREPLEMVIAAATPIVERVIFCTVTTVSPDGEPRSRIMHPVWNWDGPAPSALVSARRTPVKTRHLAGNDRITCCYWDPAHDVVTIDATAAWLTADEHGPAWSDLAATPPPVGFDPAMIWPAGPDAEGVAFLRFAAHRVVVTPAGRAGMRWVATGPDARSGVREVARPPGRPRPR